MNEQNHIPKNLCEKAPRDPETYAIIGAAMRVHRELGHCFLEKVYHAALVRELENQRIPFKQELAIPVYYQNQPLPVNYRADFVCYGKIIVEIKALQNLNGQEEAQVLNYLKATKITRGLLFNFGSSSLTYKRLVFNHPSH